MSLQYPANIIDMSRPDIKTFHENWRDHYIAPLSDRPHFLGQSAFDIRWKKSKLPVNIKTNGKIFEMEISAPGFTKDELDVSIQDDILTIKAERQKLESHKSEYVLREFNADKMERKFKLNKGVGHEKIEAKFKNGILKLTFIDVPTEEEQWFKNN